MSLLKVNNIQNVSGQPNLGKILQVVQTYYTTPTSQSITGSTYTDITGMSAAITPSSTNSRIIIHARWFGENSTNWDGGFGLKRNGTGYKSSGTTITMTLSITGIGNLTSFSYYTNELSSHKSSPTGNATATLSAGTYTVVITCDSNTDNNDKGNCALIAIPTL